MKLIYLDNGATSFPKPESVYLAMEKKAEAWRKYNEAAIVQIIAPILPEIARAIAEPLSKIDRITMVNTGGGGEAGIARMTGEVARAIAQVPPGVESRPGLRLEDLLARLRPALETATASAVPAAAAAAAASAPELPKA